MNQSISKLLRTSVIAATLIVGAASVHAEVYTGDTGHYLQAPQGYQAQASAQGFNGQGMGRGQLMQQQAQMPVVQPQAMATTTVSPRMLPQGAVLQPQAAAVQIPVVQSAAQPAAPLTVMTTTQPMATPVAYNKAVVGVPSAQALAAMEPAAGNASLDAGTNVLLSPSCGSPGNHRQHKGINTSTTVGNDCFN